MSEIIFGFDQDKVVNLQLIGNGYIYRNVTIYVLAMLYAMKLYFYWYLICTASVPDLHYLFCGLENSLIYDL